MSASFFAKQLVSSIGELPAIDPVVEKVLTLVSDPGTSPKMLAEVIQGDVALSTRILQLSNSAIFGLTRQVSSIDHAVFILGYNEIRNLALLSSTFDLIKRGGSTDILLSLWNHLLTTAICARSLSRKFLRSVTSLAYVSGLLHDIGKIPFAYQFPQEYTELFEKHGQLPGKMLLAENDFFECNHQELGKLLLDKWNLPEEISHIAECHHKVSTNENEEEEDINGFVEIADAFAYLVTYNSVTPEYIDILFKRHLGHTVEWQSTYEEIKEIVEDELTNLVVT